MSHNHNNSRLIADQTVPDIITDIPKNIMTNTNDDVIADISEDQEVYRHPSPTHPNQNYQISQSETAIPERIEKNENTSNVFQEQLQ